ncbi:hypothetical protein EDC01DRAFT_286349 [Geopyxis carbonaria]|nr:hypothetical protein EDC01DRAFT_286349 [Geopyxis carbonaria]
MDEVYTIRRVPSRRRRPTDMQTDIRNPRRRSSNFRLLMTCFLATVSGPSVAFAQTAPTTTTTPAFSPLPPPPASTSLFAFPALPSGAQILASESSCRSTYDECMAGFRACLDSVQDLESARKETVRMACEVYRNDVCEMGIRERCDEVKQRESGGGGGDDDRQEEEEDEDERNGDGKRERDDVPDDEDDGDASTTVTIPLPVSASASRSIMIDGLRPGPTFTLVSSYPLPPTSPPILTQQGDDGPNNDAPPTLTPGPSPTDLSGPRPSRSSSRAQITRTITTFSRPPSSQISVGPDQRPGLPPPPPFGGGGGGGPPPGSAFDNAPGASPTGYRPQRGPSGLEIVVTMTLPVTSPSETKGLKLGQESGAGRVGPSRAWGGAWAAGCVALGVVVGVAGWT